MGRTESVIFKNDTCFLCGLPYTETHHIFHGTANRKISDRYGYVVRLCPKHHTGDAGVHFNRELDLFFMKKAQEHFEKNHGSRQDFIKVFGKSFMEE